jgi:PhzF family phenazine biosynthesis protein
MKIKLFQVDAFSNKLFSGNPAAVCMLNNWLDDDIMQKIAEENNLSETAFIVAEKNYFQIRWFTPIDEIELCGHATLAAAHVIFNYYEYKSNEIIFNSITSGILKVKKENDLLTLNFPVDKGKKVLMPKDITNGLGKEPVEAYKGKTDYMFVYKTQKDIQTLSPNFDILLRVNSRGFIVTAKGDKVDFVSRFFAPSLGVNEDPVTGSACTMLTPYWVKKLEKNELLSMQLSRRKGTLICKLVNDRVYISGEAVTYLKGEIEII